VRVIAPEVVPPRFLLLDSSSTSSSAKLLLLLLEGRGVPRGAMRMRMMVVGAVGEIVVVAVAGVVWFVVVRRIVVLRRSCRGAARVEAPVVLDQRVVLVGVAKVTVAGEGSRLPRRKTAPAAGRGESSSSRKKRTEGHSYSNVA